jgi:hypothetical protein
MESATTRRILDQLGEPETILGTDYTAADLKLFIPGFLLAFLVMGMMPTGWGTLGFVLGGAIMLGTAGVIWAAPPHRVAHKWVRDVVRYQIIDRRGDTLLLSHDDESEPDAARSLTNIETVLRRWDSVKRADNGVVGAVRVHPANMALADKTDWEQASDALAEMLRSLSFDIQLYSTARPVDASRIVAPYRDRLGDRDVRENDRLRGVVQAYRETLPEEFDRRRTSVREYYVLVTVEELDVQLADQTVWDTLREAPVVGPLCAMIGAGRSDLSEGELLVRQQRELNSRLQRVRRGITELPGCHPEPVTAARLTDLLEEYWTGQPSHHADEGTGSIRFHQMPIIRPDPEREPATSDDHQGAVENGRAMN